MNLQAITYKTAEQ